MPALVYRWPDGTEVFLQKDMSHEMQRIGGVPVLSVRLLGTTVLLEPNRGTLYLASSTAGLADLCLHHEARKKLLGLAVDLGADVRSRPGSTGVILANDRHLAAGEFLDYPCWVSDEEWESRYRLGYERLSPPGRQDLGGPFIGSVEGLSVRSDRDPRFKDGFSYVGSWGSPALSRRTEACGSVEEVVDEVVKREILLPQSYRAFWEASNVELGEWVLPEPGEVEILRAIGEPLPFFWGPERVWAWLAEHVQREADSGERVP